MKAHGEIAIKGLTNYVYDDDNSIKFPSGDISKSEAVCASSETKEDLATPKTSDCPTQNPQAIVNSRRVEEAPPPASSHDNRSISIQNSFASLA